MRLTERWIRNLSLPAAGKKYIADDQATGLYLVVSATGLRSFVFRYSTSDGHRRKHHIGRWPEWNATMARQEVALLRRKLALGTDPQAQRRAERTAAADTTISALALEYLDRYGSKKRSGSRDREILERDVLPKFGAKSVSSVSRSDVRRLFEAKSHAAPVAANRLLACLSKLFNWGLEQELVAANPCQGIKKNQEKARDRVLTETETRRLWHALDRSSGVSANVGIALKLILVTGQRPGEIVGMRRSEIEGDWWMLPGVRTKNGKPHRVPLVSLARALLKSQNGGGDYVFPARRGSAATLLVNSLAHAIRKCDFFELRPWTPHDLRRTAATSMASAGVQPHIIDRLLNHTDPSVRARHYDSYLYDAEKQAALKKWEQVLRHIIRAD